MNANEKQKVLDRARKMWARAQSTTFAAEAETAMRMVQTYVDKYNLDMADIMEEATRSGKTGDVVDCRTWFKDKLNYRWKKSVPVWMLELAHAVRVLYDMEIRYGAPARVEELGKMIYARTLNFYGTKEDLEIGLWTLDMLVDTLERVTEQWWAEYRKSDAYLVNKKGGSGRAKASKNDFRCGFAFAIVAKAKEVKAAAEQVATASGTALVVVKKDALVAEFGDFEYQKGKEWGVKVGAAFGAGQEAGQQVNVGQNVLN